MHFLLLRYVDSDLFCGPAPFDVFKWKMRVYPIGKSFISPHLVLVEGPRRIKVCFSFKTIDTPFGKLKKRSEVNSKDFAAKSFATEGYEFAVYCIDFEPRLLHMSSRTPGLTIQVKIAINDFEETFNVKQIESNNIALLAAMATMYEDKRYTDIEFEVNSRILSAHKAVLAARSPVFAAMFDFDGKKNRVQITDVEYEVMDAILAFVYTGRSNLNRSSKSKSTKGKERPSGDLIEFAIKLYEAADKYALLSLIAACEDFVTYNISKESVVRALLAGHFHNSKQIKDTCFKFMAMCDDMRRDLSDFEELDQFDELTQEMKIKLPKLRADFVSSKMSRLNI